MSVKSFIDWWDGVNAFMGDGPPSPDQWAKIKARVEELRHAAPDRPAAPLAAVGTAPKAPVPDWRSNPNAWNGLFVAALMDEHGCDAESASEGLLEKGLDKSRDPKVGAGEIASKWGGLAA
jgi:hypothetical protein